jgi:hypothetical protein
MFIFLIMLNFNIFNYINLLKFKPIKNGLNFNQSQKKALPIIVIL